MSVVFGDGSARAESMVAQLTPTTVGAWRTLMASANLPTVALTLCHSCLGREGSAISTTVSAGRAATCATTAALTERLATDRTTVSRASIAE